MEQLSEFWLLAPAELRIIGSRCRRQADQVRDTPRCWQVVAEISWCQGLHFQNPHIYSSYTHILVILCLSLALYFSPTLLYIYIYIYTYIHTQLFRERRRGGRERERSISKWWAMLSTLPGNQNLRCRVPVCIRLHVSSKSDGRLSFPGYLHELNGHQGVGAVLAGCFR